MVRRLTMRRITSVLAVLGLPLVGACDNELVNPPTPVDPLFARYVSIGNSITAGFQAGGINDALQLDAYPVLLAQMMDTPFNVPLLRFPGCPAPYTNIFTNTRIGGTGPTFCAARTLPIPTFINNVAVPGAESIDPTNNLDASSSANALTTLLLGGRTQLEAAAAAKPTFVSVWIGNNDVLGSALSGTDQGVTPTATFAANFDAMMTALDGMGVQGGILLGVVKVTNTPNLSPGVAYFGAKAQGALPPTFTVDNSCAPAVLGGVGESTLVPFAYGFGVLLAQASQGVSVTLNCATDPPVLSGAEITNIVTAIAGYNQTVQAAATARGWAFWDPNVVLDSVKAAGDIPLFPNPAAPTAPFGQWFSSDGVHPSSQAHQVVAQRAWDAIVAEYGITP
ncbi:MAG: SGNH/GDSL hydrolase family protein [Gemmatimonadota bacterium]|nr:SGNH/GDSL hydrolase family protein [Gemmatimonadota bacterium]MDH3478711.1 SGNH/GDSL hydrolase family protein [Gemmatimonadota bacterium]